MADPVRRAAAALLLIAAKGPADPATLRSIDERVAAVGERLAVANAALCAHRAPATGLVLGTLDQYPPERREAVRRAFGFPAPVSVEAVVPASAADRAGVVAGDGVEAIDGRVLAASPDGPTGALRDEALAAIASAPPGRPLALVLTRNGSARTATLTPPAGCAVDVVVQVDGRSMAATGRQTIAVAAALPLRYDDEALAVVLAHELAHVILGHTAQRGARSIAVLRGMEDAADRLSVTLLRNAGVDPSAPARFWSAHGDEVEPGRPLLHRRPRERAALLAAEAARIGADGQQAPRPTSDSCPSPVCRTGL